MWRESLKPRLTAKAAALVDGLDDVQAAAATELRFFLDRPAWVCGTGVVSPWKMDRREMDELVAALCGHARYAYEREMARGFIPLPGGHRAGVCGSAAWRDGQCERMSGITSVCVRIARQIPGASAGIRRFLLLPDGAVHDALILGPPGCGKTTVLRDAALWLAGECGMSVSAADERGELFALPPDAPVDVLSGAPKAQAMGMLLRSMSPQVLVCDEIGCVEDVDALLDAVRCGVGVIATAHAGSAEEVFRRPALERLCRARAFERYILLGRRARVRAVYDRDGVQMEGWSDEEPGCSADCADGGERRGLSAGGRGDQAGRLCAGHAALPFAHA